MVQKTKKKRVLSSDEEESPEKTAVKKKKNAGNEDAGKGKKAKKPAKVSDQGTSSEVEEVKQTVWGEGNSRFHGSRRKQGRT
jgi:hypothetical protein